MLLFLADYEFIESNTIKGLETHKQHFSVNVFQQFNEKSSRYVGQNIYVCAYGVKSVYCAEHNTLTIPIPSIKCLLATAV